MTPENVLDAAKQGNSQAIAALINRQLQRKGFTAKIKLSEGCLHVMIEGATVPDQATVVTYITNGIRNLRVASISKLAIHGRITGEDLPQWSDRVELSEGLAATTRLQAETVQTPLEEDRIKCPQCSSTQIMAAKKGFGAGKAAAGAVLLGPMGLAGGMIGANKIVLSCLKCGYQWEPSDIASRTESAIETRVTQTKVKVMTVPERITFAVASIVVLPIVGLIVLIIPILGWILYAGILIVAVFVFPGAMLVNDPEHTNRLVGDCPHCAKEASTGIKSESFKCSHCKRQIIVRDRQFYSL